MANEYYAEVVRSRDPKGPGTLTLYRDDEPVGQWSCITGGDQTDPKILGGLCPPIAWVMIEPIELRTHPQGHKMEMARLLPLWEGKALYPKRTYEMDKWPFMIHVAGNSSGCIAIHGDQWRQAVAALNKAYTSNTFLIEVRDQTPS